MKIAAAIFLLGAALSSAQFTNQSAPFWLKYSSSTAGTDVTYLAACHAGAGQEGLCPEPAGSAEQATAPTAHDQFFLNETSASPNGSVMGAITWNLPTANGNPVSSILALNSLIVSNSAIPIFSPGDQGLYIFGFDENNALFIHSAQDDSHAVAGGANTPTASNVAYYRWHVCWTFVGGYYYNALVWVTGGGRPTNPTCTPVMVYREWAPTS